MRRIAFVTPFNISMIYVQRLATYHAVYIMLKMLLKITILLCAICQFNLALAETPKSFTAANGIKYMSGGIGHDEVMEMGPYAKNFTLNLLL